ncbi:hypothetical protein R4J00_02780 [Brachyspira intermedia]|uniref:hypothetical protein n=1 Tax=Brachyspira intermedia TaxID=84377 RepID=UPI003007336A
MEVKKKDNRGGARPNTGGAREGAGRKKKDDKDKKPSYRVSLRLNEEENNIFEENSKNESLSIGQYIRKNALMYLLYNRDKQMINRKNILDLKNDLEKFHTILHALKGAVIRNEIARIPEIKMNMINSELMNSRYDFNDINNIDINQKRNFDMYLSYFKKLILDIHYESDLYKMKDYFGQILIIKIFDNVCDILDNILCVNNDGDNNEK